MRRRSFGGGHPVTVAALLVLTASLVGLSLWEARDRPAETLSSPMNPSAPDCPPRKPQS